MLRIEDTDRERSTPENVEQILDALRWLELDWDEGPILQSQRAERHREALAGLLESGHAYRSTAAAEDVKAYKQRHGADRGFRGEDEREGAVRLRVPDEGATIVHDVIRGETRFEHVHLDDPVMALDARCSTTSRSRSTILWCAGEDHLSNTPAAAGAGGAQAPQPLCGHLPLRMARTGELPARGGSVRELRDAGLLAEAVRNYLALLGWGGGDDATVMSTQELVERFALERVSRNPARLDETKLRWLNGVYIRELPVPELAGRLTRFARETGAGSAAAGDLERFERAVAISQEKIQTLADFWPLAGFLFERREAEQGMRERLLDERGRERLVHTRAALARAASFDEQGVQEALEAVQQRLGAKPREIYQPLRLAIAGSPISPGIFESVALLGREETLWRVDAALAASA